MLWTKIGSLRESCFHEYNYSSGYWSIGVDDLSEDVFGGDQCRRWLASLSQSGSEAKVPEIADYEIRRELLRMDKLKDIKRLDTLKETLGYIPLTTPAMLLAAQLWAQVRKQGKPTTHDKALDGDVILAAQALVIKAEGHDVIVATTNVDHLSRLVDAKRWRDI